MRYQDFMTRHFQRTIEDFTCQHCGAQVVGNGYTNHCPQCLWSLHVDVNPGDRAATCGGLMAPIQIDQKRGSYVILHECRLCGFRRPNRVLESDNMDAVAALARRLSDTRG